MTSTFALCFEGDKLLLVNHEERGFDVPGGHIERGEDLIAALRRELREEASVEIFEPELFTLIEVEVGNSPPPDYKYPFPKSYMIGFLARIERLDPFAGDFETTERRLFSPEEARATDWVKRHAEAYEAALAAIISKKS